MRVQDTHDVPVEVAAATGTGTLDLSSWGRITSPVENRAELQEFKRVQSL
jgi:hypothetical protein